MGREGVTHSGGLGWAVGWVGLAQREHREESESESVTSLAHTHIPPCSHSDCSMYTCLVSARLCVFPLLLVLFCYVSCRPSSFSLLFSSR